MDPENYEAIAVVEEDDEWTWIVLMRDLKSDELAAVRVDEEQAKEVTVSLMTHHSVLVSVEEERLL